MRLSPSGEMYLKTIATLQETGGDVHVQDIAVRLGVRMPSVTQALRRLTEKSFVTHSRYGTVMLTPLGEGAARDIRARHRVLEEFLTRVLHVSPVVASQDACEMEHVVSPVTLQRLAEFLVFVGTNPGGADNAVSQFTAYSHAREEGGVCSTCGAAPGSADTAGDGGRPADLAHPTAEVEIVPSSPNPGSTRRHA